MDRKKEQPKSASFFCSINSTSRIYKLLAVSDLCVHQQCTGQQKSVWDIASSVAKVCLNTLYV